MSGADQEKSTRASKKRSRFFVVSLGLVGVVLIVLIAHTTYTSTNGDSSAPTFGGPRFSYTCCTASVVNTIYRPGELVTVRWDRSVQASDGVRATSMTLSAGLSGPFRTVITLKKDSVGRHPHLGRTRANAVPIHVMDNVIENPVSRMRIPTNAKPGWYNLTIATTTKDLSVSGAAVIRIESPSK